MTIGRVSFAASLLAMTAAVVVSATQAAPPATPRVLRVTSSADDAGPETLRSAIEASNQTTERETIAIEINGGGSRVITLKSALPPIKGPVLIEGTAWKRTGEFAVIDGSGYITSRGPEGCPGAVAGQFGANVRTMTSPGLQFIDTADVEIAGVEIRHFCIGILINRATGVSVRDNRIVENHGGAGVMLTGDDGQGSPTSTTTIHNKVFRNDFLDNGDGLELTRGAAFNLIADNVFRSTAANPESSQGIEILRGNDNVVSGNRFEGYSDGLQINWGDRNYIVANTFIDNTFGLNLTGVGNVVDGNVITGNRVGIVVRPAEPSPVVQLTRNRVSSNGRDIRRCEAGGSCDPAMVKGAIVLGLPGLEHESFVGSRGRGVAANPATMQHICPEHAPECQAAPNRSAPRPLLTATATTGEDFAVSGTVKGAPTTRYVVEVFGNTEAGSAESELFLEQAAVHTNAAGAASFTIHMERRRVERVRSLTATVTAAEGATSALSDALQLQHAPSR